MHHSSILWILTSLLLTRVLGQLVVAVHPVSFLPPMSEWSSGLIHYPLLLPIQVVIPNQGGQNIFSRRPEYLQNKLESARLIGNNNDAKHRGLFSSRVGYVAG